MPVKSQGRELTFGVSGKLIMNALVMYDRQTDSLWSQFLGFAVKGPLEGTPLLPLGSTLVSWSELARRCTPTRWCSIRAECAAATAITATISSGSAGVIGETNADDRLGRKEFVLGLQLDDRARAYPFRYLNDRPLLNDRLGDTDLLVAFDRDDGAGLIFDRRLGGRTLTFALAEGQGPGSGLLLEDEQTSTLWSGLTGEAISGPLAGERLRQLPSFAVFWFAWTDFFPGAEIFEP